MADYCNFYSNYSLFPTLKTIVTAGFFKSANKGNGLNTISTNIFRVCGPLIVQFKRR